MSQSMTERLKKKLSTKSFTAMLVFGAIILVFVFFGYSGRLGGGGVGSAAQVNDSLISVASLQTAEENMRQMYGQMLGNDAFRLRSEALRGLIERELMSQAAQKSGIIVADEEIRDVITQDIPVFHDKNQFQKDYYFRYLDMTHQTPRDFEQSIRQQQESLRARHLFDVAGELNKVELAQWSALNAFKMNVEFVKLDEEGLEKNAAATKSEAEAALADAAFLKKAQDFFNAHKSDYSHEEQVHAQHILLRLNPGAAEDEAKKVEARAEELKKKAEKGDFAKLANQNSEDPGSKAKGGDLGFFAHDRMVKEFADAAFAAPVGKVIGPVKTNYGYHLIKVLEKRPAEEANFDKQKIEVAQKLLSEDKVQKELASLDEAIGKGDEAALDKDIKAMNGKWEETGFFSLSQESAPKLNSMVANNALSELNPDQKLLKHLVRDGNNKFIMKLKEVKMDTPVPLEAMMKNMTEATHSNAMFMGWVGDFKKTARVEVNNHILKP